MLHYDELKQAIDGGYIQGDKVMIVRRDGKIFDYVLHFVYPFLVALN